MTPPVTCLCAMNFDHLRYNLRALLFEWLRMPDKAMAAYIECLRADPADVQAARSVGWILSGKQRWPAAAEWFDKAVAIDPGHADTWFNLGYAREQTGDLDGALSAFAKTVELNPKHDRAWYGAGMIYSHRGDYAAAMAHLQQAASLQPMNGEAWYALGMAQYHGHDPEAVAQTIQHCASHEPQTAKRLIQETQRADLAHLLPF